MWYLKCVACAEFNNEPLAWLPLTASALTWRLLCLDAAVCYGTGPESRPWRERLLLYRYVQLPVLVAGEPTGGEAGRIATACGVPTYMDASFFPTLPLTAVPMDAVELTFDKVAMLNGDEEEMRSHVPAGACFLCCSFFWCVLRCDELPKGDTQRPSGRCGVDLLLPCLSITRLVHWQFFRASGRCIPAPNFF